MIIGSKMTQKLKKWPFFQFSRGDPRESEKTRFEEAENTGPKPQNFRKVIEKMPFLVNSGQNHKNGSNGSKSVIIWRPTTAEPLDIRVGCLCAQWNGPMGLGLAFLCWNTNKIRSNAPLIMCHYLTANNSWAPRYVRLLSLLRNGMGQWVYKSPPGGIKNSQIPNKMP